MKYRFDDFKGIIDELRGEHGCPWDREQTYESLKPCMVNEMVEALAAIDLLSKTGNGDNLCEELGDVLLQIVLLARIAQEEGRFTMEDVIQGISEKMIRRHPHVFDQEQAGDSGQVLVNWERIKQQERKNQDPEEKQREKAACREAAKQVMNHLHRQWE